jgi:hypothetical protein
MGRRRYVRGITRAARGIVSDAAWREVGLEVASEVAGLDVVGAHDYDRA